MRAGRNNDASVETDPGASDGSAREEGGGPDATVNLELILDVSGSMVQALDSGETRIDVAKRVLNNVIAAIPERDGINVELRIYGHEGDNSEALTPEATEGGEEEGDESEPASTRDVEPRSNGAADTTAAVGAPADPAACPDLGSAEEVVLGLRARGLPVGDYEAYTAETDPNDLLGRPGGYKAKATFLDETLDGDDAFEVENGGSVEIYADADGAERRESYVQALGEELPLLGEYDAREGPVLLRLSRRLPPDEASAYVDALAEVAGCGEG